MLFHSLEDLSNHQHARFVKADFEYIPFKYLSEPRAMYKREMNRNKYYFLTVIFSTVYSIIIPFYSFYRLDFKD